MLFISRKAAVSLAAIVAAAAVPALLASCGGTSTTTMAPTQSYPTQTSATGTQAAGVPDWTSYGYAVAGSKDIQPGAASTVMAGNFVFNVPANAFNAPVKFEVLTADPAMYGSKIPSGQTGVLAFALRVTDLNTGQPVAQFQNPVMMVASSSRISPGSLYYNVTPDGAFTLNPTGMQVKQGELDHPVILTTLAWVITSGGSAAGGASTSGSGY